MTVLVVLTRSRLPYLGSYAFIFFSMTEVAVELEAPYGADTNDLPLLSMQDR